MEGELEVADVPKSVLIDFLGYIEDTLGQLVQTSDTGESFALLFQVTTDTQARKMCFLIVVLDSQKRNIHQLKKMLNYKIQLFH